MSFLFLVDLLSHFNSSVPTSGGTVFPTPRICSYLWQGILPPLAEYGSHLWQSIFLDSVQLYFHNRLRLFLGLFSFIDPSLIAMCLNLILLSKVLLSERGWFLKQKTLILNPFALWSLVTTLQANKFDSPFFQQKRLSSGTLGTWSRLDQVRFSSCSVIVGESRELCQASPHPSAVGMWVTPSFTPGR
jgi:hypothetical protein